MAGWLNGSHPLPRDGAVARPVCFAWNDNPCYWTATVQVVACNGFYLYSLPSPPTTCLRYCGNGDIRPIATTPYVPTSVPSTTKATPGVVNLNAYDATLVYAEGTVKLVDQNLADVAADAPAFAAAWFGPARFVVRMIAPT